MSDDPQRRHGGRPHGGRPGQGGRSGPPRPGGGGFRGGSRGSSGGGFRGAPGGPRGGRPFRGAPGGPGEPGGPGGPPDHFRERGGPPPDRRHPDHGGGHRGGRSGTGFSAGRAGTPPPMRDETELPPGGDRPRRPWVDRGPRPPGGPRQPGGPRPLGGRGQQPWRRPGTPWRPDAPPHPVRPGAPAPPLEEGEELVAGRRPVEEAFAAARPARRLLVTPQRRQALEKIVLHATTLRIPIVEVEGGSLTALAGFDGQQGVAVVVEERRFAAVEDVLARAIERKEAAFLLVLDSLEDPQSVGTLLRSAEAAGVHGVLFPTERQAPLSPAAVKASAGATEHLLLAPVEDLPGTLTDLRLRGLRIVGADETAALVAREADLRGPIALVVGSEGHGLSPAVRKRCDLFVRLPMRGAIGSLNAAVAGSVLLFEVVGQRDIATAAEVTEAPPAKPAPKPRARKAPAPEAPPAKAAPKPRARKAPAPEAPPAKAAPKPRARKAPAPEEPDAGEDLLPG